MIKPLGVLLVLCVVAVLLLCLIFALWRMGHNYRRANQSKAVTLGIVSLAIAVLCAYATYAVSPKGGRTIAQLQLPEKREFILRHYRYGWFEYPKLRFYARDNSGRWTSFAVISELINPNDISLVYDEAKQGIAVGIAGAYDAKNNYFTNIDGSSGKVWQLAPGIEPNQDELNGTIASHTSVLVSRGE